MNFEQPMDSSDAPRVERTPPSAERIEKTSELAMLRFPDKRFATAAIAAALLEACTPQVMQPVESPVSAVELRVEDPAARKQLEHLVTEIVSEGTDVQATTNSLLGPEAHAPAVWQQERERWAGERGASLINPYLIPIGTEKMMDIVDAMPRLWSSIHVTDRVTFLTRTDFHADDQKCPQDSSTPFKREGRWEAVCDSGYNPIDKASQVRCNTDLMNEYGTEEALQESFFHEYSHGADPSRLPMPMGIKADLWKREWDIQRSQEGPYSAYVEQWRKSVGPKPNGPALKVLLGEGWAEHMETVFQTAPFTADTSSWATWKPKYEQALIDHYGATPHGAEQTFELVKTYFDVADPSFEPWESAKKLKQLLPPMKKFTTSPR